MAVRVSASNDLRKHSEDYFYILKLHSLQLAGIAGDHLAPADSWNRGEGRRWARGCSSAASAQACAP